MRTTSLLTVALAVAILSTVGAAAAGGGTAEAAEAGVGVGQRLQAVFRTPALEVRVEAVTEAGTSSRRPQPPGQPFVPQTRRDVCVDVRPLDGSPGDGACGEGFFAADPSLTAGVVTATLTSLYGTITVQLAVVGTGAPAVVPTTWPSGGGVSVYRPATASGSVTSPVGGFVSQSSFAVLQADAGAYAIP